MTADRYYEGVDDARRYWVKRCEAKIEKLREARKRLTSTNLTTYCDGYLAGVAWCRKQTEGENPHLIPDPKADNDEDLILPWNTLP